MTEPARLEVLRKGRIEEVTVIIGELPDEGELAAAVEPESTTVDSLGLVVGDLSAGQRDQLGLEQGGVIVREVKPGAAERADIEPGDLILMFNSKPVEGTGQFRKLLVDSKPGRSVAALIQRDHGRLFLAVSIPEK